MSSKIAIVLCLAGLLLISSVLAQTNEVNRQTNSNMATNAGRPSNVNANHPKSNPARLPSSVTKDKGIACQYLTESDAENIYGQSMVYFTSTTYEKEIACIYAVPNDLLGLGVKFKAETFPTIKQAKANLTMKVKISQLVNLQFPQKELPKTQLPVLRVMSGIGDSAYLAANRDNNEYIYVQKNKTVFEITALGRAGAHFPAEVIKTVAKKIAESF